MNESKDQAKPPVESKPAKATEKQAPKPVDTRTYVMAKDVYDGSRFRKGSKVTRKQLGDGKLEEWMKAGNVIELKKPETSETK